MSPRAHSHGFGRASARPGSRASFKVRGVEGWRGAACLMVVAYHVWQNMDVDGDGLGPTGGSPQLLSAILSVDVVVDLFFVLSGLLLFLPFAHAALDDQRPVPSRREFLWRRCVRLFPVYWVLVLLCWSTRNFGFGTAQWRDLGEHLLLLQAFDSERIFYTIGPAWTLSVEWIFYLSLAALGPATVVWVRRVNDRSDRVVRLSLLLMPVIAASLLYKLNVQWVWQIPITDWAWRFGPAAKADDFAIGMLLAVAMVALGDRRAPFVLTPLLAAAGVALIYLARVRTGADPDELLVIWRHPLAASGWALVLAAIMTCRSDTPARWIDNPVAVRTSILAYTIYLVHEPVILVFADVGLLPAAPEFYPVNLLAVSATTIVAAWVLHRLVEEPWVDLAALQAKGGGRRDLYAEVADHAPPQAGSVAGMSLLRGQVLRARTAPGASVVVQVDDDREPVGVGGAGR